MKQSLQLRIGQSLTMTPQLQQAIKLLQLSSLELQTEIQETLETNPLLEQDDNLGEITVANIEQGRANGADRDEPTELRSSAEALAENRSEQTLPDDFGIDTGWEQIYDSMPNSTTQSLGSRDDNRDMFENQAGTIDVLNDHLIWQLDCSHLSETDYEIGLAIIDSTNDSGYLTQSVEDIYAGLQTQYEELEFDEVEAVLHLVQRFDPVGVAARSPSECMSIQLGQYAQDTPHLKKAIALVENYLEQLAAMIFHC